MTDKLARRPRNVAAMIDIEMPCCETATLVEELAETVPCETCGVILELDSPAREAVPVAA